MRVFRPWVVASVAGAAFGALLLTLPPPSETESFYPEFAPRAAMSDARAESPARADLSESVTSAGKLAESTAPAATDTELLPADFERVP